VLWHVDPTRAVAYLNLGDALVQTNKKDHAKKAYQTYLEPAPNGRDAAAAQDKIKVL
jgi:predicted negative regulator of RcsB-dependent stress response